MAHTDSERVLRSRIAAHTSWALTDNRSGRTAPARAALKQRFLDQANGDPVRAEHFLESTLCQAFADVGASST